MQETDFKKQNFGDWVDWVLLHKILYHTCTWFEAVSSFSFPVLESCNKNKTLSTGDLFDFCNFTSCKES